jgi:hypothetical protein
MLCVEVLLDLNCSLNASFSQSLYMNLRDTSSGGSLSVS